jgi:hypothetical protein
MSTRREVGAAGSRTTPKESSRMTDEERLVFELEETDDIEDVKRMLNEAARLKATAPVEPESPHKKCDER